jgi:hypothetical protein
MLWSTEFTTETLEVAVTPGFSLVFYCNEDESIFGTKLYKSADSKKKLVAVCERNQAEKTTRYAFTTGTIKVTNDNKTIVKLLGEEFTAIPDGLKKIDFIKVIPSDTSMPVVSEAGIINCLRQWRLGDTYSSNGSQMFFQMVTNKIEYIFSINTRNTNIYCGASINIPYEGGLFGSGQYFRIRNFKDNNEPFCRFYSDLGKDPVIPEFEKITCESGQCTVTKQGFYWPVKHYTEDKIVLAGCNDDEYVYLRNEVKAERFMDIIGESK